MSKRAPLTFTAETVAASSASPVKSALSANISTDKRESATPIKRANTETEKLANTRTKKSRAGRQFLAAHVMPEAAKQFKLLAVQKDRTTQDMLIEAINDLFSKYGLSRIAD